jgi:hypothetical protein
MGILRILPMSGAAAPTSSGNVRFSSSHFPTCPLHPDSIPSSPQFFLASAGQPGVCSSWSNQQSRLALAFECEHVGESETLVIVLEPQTPAGDLR